MFKKNKQLITGFILGAILFTMVPVGATIQDYLLQKSTAKVMVDGKGFANKELPVLIYKGYNYIPAATFREICDIIGVGFEWAGEKNEIQINTNKKALLSPTTEERKGESMVNVEKDGYKLLVVDGVEYITPREIGDYFVNNDLDYRFVYFQEEREFKIHKIIDRRDIDKDITLLRNIPTQIFQGMGHINYNYFKETILPLIK